MSACGLTVFSLLVSYCISWTSFIIHATHDPSIMALEIHSIAISNAGSSVKYSSGKYSTSPAQLLKLE